MIVNQEQPTKLNEPPTNIQCYSKMKCANRYCYYNNEFAWEMDKSKILSVKCPFCSTTVYHSEACLKVLNLLILRMMKRPIRRYAFHSLKLQLIGHTQARKTTI